MIPASLYHNAKPISIGAAAWYPFSESMAKKYTVKNKFEGETKAYVVKNGMIGIPLNCATNLTGVPDTRVCPAAKKFKMVVPPRDTEQARCIKESVALFKGSQAGKCNHRIRAGTGRGKSYMGIAISCELATPTLIVVNKTDLLNQWKEALLKFTNLKEDDIGIIQADKCHYKGKTIVLGMIHSLSSDQYGEEVKDYFGLVITDECHRLSAETFMQTGLMFNSLHRLGLSAQKSRSDGLMYLVDANIGIDMVITEEMPVKPKILMWQSAYRIPTVVRNVKGIMKRVPIPHSAGRMSGVYADMANDMPRNKKIIEFVQACYRKERTVVLFADSREHLNIMEIHLRNAGFTKEDFGYYVGGMKPAALKESMFKRVVLATYKMCSEATDAPHWSAGVLMTPHADVQQAVGRLLREHPDKPVPVILDIVDIKEVILKGYSYSRLKYYHSIQAEIVKYEQ